MKVVVEEEQKHLTKEEKTQKEEAQKQSEFLRRAKGLLRMSADARRRYDYEWMVRDLFRRGYQFSKYQPSTQTLILASRQTAKIPINIIAAQMRAIRNMVTSFRPKWEILPRSYSEGAKTQARYSQRLLDYTYDRLKLKTMIKETVMQGLQYSVGGPWQIYYDKIKKEVNIWLIDPFDFYFDPYAESLEDAEFCIKAVRRPVDEIKNNPDFDKKAREEITGGENRLAVSEYKQLMLQAMREASGAFKDESYSTSIVFEGYFKTRDENTGEVDILRCDWTDKNTIPLVYEKTGTDEFNFEIYRADINPKEIYGEGWMKHVLPINRVINHLESSMFDYANRVAKGRIVVDRDSGVRAIHNVHGEIISKNRGAEVRAMDMPSLPVAVSNQVIRFQRYIEDIGAVHESSLGRMPVGIRSGLGIAELKQSDSTGQDDLVDNLEDFLSAVGKKVLRCIAENYTTYQVVYDLGAQENEEKYFAVVGEKSGKKGHEEKGHEGQVKIGPDWFDVATIAKDNQIRVTIGSWLGYTKEAMQEKVLQLAEKGLIDQKTFLRLWEFGGVDEIVQETRKESILKQAMSKPPAPGQPNVSQYDLAQTENDMMVLEAKDMPVSENDDHLVHIAVHQDALARGADDLVGKHIELHNMYLEHSWGTSPQAQNPSSGPEGADAVRNQQVAAQQPPGGSPGAGGPPTPIPQPGLGMPQAGGQPPGVQIP